MQYILAYIDTYVLIIYFLQLITYYVWVRKAHLGTSKNLWYYIIVAPIQTHTPIEISKLGHLTNNLIS